MSHGGKKRTPTAILKLAGSKHEKYAASKERAFEPMPEIAAPEMPAMPPAACEYWVWLLPQLEQLGVVSRDNRHSLKRYCISMAAWDELAVDVAENGVTQMNKVGGSSKRGEFLAMMDMAIECRRLETEFGLTPSSRAGIQAIAKVQAADNNPRGKYLG